MASNALARTPDSYHHFDRIWSAAYHVHSRVPKAGHVLLVGRVPQQIVVEFQAARQRGMVATRMHEVGGSIVGIKIWPKRPVTGLL